MARGGEADLEPLASIVQRLGVLLAAGVTPASGWSYVADSARGATAERARQVADAAGSGRPIADAIVEAALPPPGSGRRRGSKRRARSIGDDAAWRGLAAAWLVATDAGASLAPTLTELAGSLRSLAQNRRDLQTSLAEPAATARLVMVLPIVGVLFGLALGFDSIGTLLTTVPGVVCLVLGILLMLMARWWSTRLVRRATPTELTPGLGLDLMAIAVSGGAAIPRARLAVAEARRRCELDLDGSESAIEEVLELSRRAGVPAAALLRSEAIEVRRIHRSEGERKAATLAVTLMLPLGVCVLPAFMLLGVAPLMISVLSSTVGSL